MQEESKIILKNVKISLQEITVNSFNYEHAKDENKELSGAYTRLLIHELINEVDRALGVKPYEQK